MALTARKTYPQLVQTKADPYSALLDSMISERDAMDVRIRALNDLIEQKNSAHEQLTAIRELAERSMADAEKYEAELNKTKSLLRTRDAKISDLESRLRQREVRVAQLEATLKMLAEADAN